ncbi:hypothetical protein KAU39_03460 [bacterium]|nr:hypothetical protein [bacterium]
MNKKAFILIEVMLVAAIGGILTTAVVPKFFNAHKKAQENVCLANRRLIERTEDLYFAQEGKHSASVRELVDTGYLDGLPRCPCGGEYLWVPYPEDSPQYNVLVCSMHGADKPFEEEITTKKKGMPSGERENGQADTVEVILSQNDFSRNMGDWQALFSEQDMEVKKGHLKGSNYAESTLGSEDWSNYTFTVSAKIIKSGKEDGDVAQIKFRANNFPENFYALMLKKSGTLELSKMQEGEWHSCLAHSFDAGNIKKWNDFKIEAEGAKLKISVNEQLKIVYTDPEPILNGGVGLRASSGIVQWDNSEVAIKR